MQAKKSGPTICRSATIILNAGVSLRESQRIIYLAYKRLDRSKRKIGRRRFSDLEIEALRSEFEKLGIPKPRKRTDMVRKVQKAYMQSNNRKLSKTFIADELRRWLLEHKQPVRRYVTESSKT